MASDFGKKVKITIFGQSHSEAIGVVIDGLPVGEEIDLDAVQKFMERRAPGRNAYSTSRKEADLPRVVSGLFEGKTCGAPICAIIENTNTRSKDYDKLKDLPRPGHADFTAWVKYGGYNDHRGGGHFSGRITAALVAAGAIIQMALEDKGIKIGSHITELHGAFDRTFENYESDINLLSTRQFPVLSDKAEERMREEIEKAAAKGDSVGGILETAIVGIPAGVGEPWFDSVEGMLSHALFSIPAVKGVEFGLGFAFADTYGSEANDAFKMDGDRVVTETNNNGGINGGITNGMPILFRTVIKPTPSIFKEQMSVSLSKKENTILKIEGRHDPAIIHRARAVVDAVSALVVADLLVGRYGTDYLVEKK